MKKYIITVAFLGLCGILSAQRTMKNMVDEKKNLPKLEKVVIGNQYGIISSPDKDATLNNVSDIEVIKRSSSDGKVSPREKAIVERVKKLPQTH